MMAAASSIPMARFHRAATDASGGCGGGAGSSRSSSARWTSAEQELLTEAYRTGGYKAAMRVLPGHSQAAIFSAALRLGLQRRQKWTTDADRDLRDLWSQGLLLTAIARRLDRTTAATYYRARRLGLTSGPPPDFEYLSAAAERTGYATSQLRQILAWAGVKVRQSRARPKKRQSGRRFYIVDIIDVDDALARWHATEPVESAARRYGVTGAHLRRLLRRAGLIPAPSKTHKHIRVTDDQVRAVLGAAR